MKRINPKTLFSDAIMDYPYYSNIYFRGSYGVKTMRFNRETTVGLCNNIDNNVMEDMRMDAGLTQKEYYKMPF